jgi:hypothetical protein
MKRTGHHGFGSKLFRHALAPFHGQIRPEFDSDGLKCQISFLVPENQDSNAEAEYSRDFDDDLRLMHGAP